MDMSTSINFPQSAVPYQRVEKQLALVGDGSIIGGGVNGYMVDKKTAEAHKITSVDQLKDPKLAALFDNNRSGKATLINCDPGWSCGDVVEFQLDKFGLTGTVRSVRGKYEALMGVDQLKDPKIAALFDTNRSGKATLINCDPGWSCGDVVEFQLDKFGLKDTVRSVRGKYEALMGETFARYRAGEPVLFYGWSPGWVVDTLRPGRDVVWLPTPFEALPPGVVAPKGALVSGVVGCAGGQDPCRMTIGAWNYQSIVNRTFLAENPAVRKLVEQFRFPLSAWIEWEGTISKTKNDRDIKKAAETWIAQNQAQFDGWVKEAAAAK